MSAACLAEILLNDAFLSEHLRRDVRRLDVAALLQSIRHDADALKDAIGALAPPAMVYSKVASDAVKGVRPLLVAHGFEVIDTAVTLECSRLTGFEQHMQPTSHVVRIARAADGVAVAKLAGEALTTSRFHMDSNLTRNEASRIKVAWVRSYFAGNRGETMVVAERVGGEAIDGFLLAFKAGDGAMVIDLVAVDACARRKGLCRAMTVAAQQQFPHARTLRVGTQGSNIDSLRAYRNIGFTVVRTEAVLHMHKLDSGAPPQGSRHEHR